MVGAPEFHVRLKRNRVVALNQRIEEFVDRDGLLPGITLREVVALEHARHGVLSRQFDHVGRTHRTEPLAVEAHFSALAVQHLEYLTGIGLRVDQHILSRKRLAGDVLAGRVADHAGEVTDQEDDLVT